LRSKRGVKRIGILKIQKLSEPWKSSGQNLLGGKGKRSRSITLYSVTIRRERREQETTVLLDRIIEKRVRIFDDRAQRERQQEARDEEKTEWERGVGYHMRSGEKKES